MDNRRLYLVASNVSIAQQEPDDIFMHVGMRIQSTRPNGNNEGVTESFIDSIITNTDRYNGLPLYVDEDRLLARDYTHLGHMLDPETGDFLSTQIGAFYEFEKVADECGVSLLAKAKIPKREYKVCQCICELFEMGRLNFSFEIKYSPSAVIIQDGVTYVDAADSNALTGVAIVSVPAYPESTALSLVAEEKQETKEFSNKANNEGADIMTLDEAMSALAEKDTKIAELTTQVTDLKSRVTVAEDKAKDMENEKKAKEEELETAKASDADKDAKIAELESKIAELEPMRAELETIKAEQAKIELAAKQDKAKAFAEKQGLNTSAEDVKKAIAELDYAALVDLSMEAEKKNADAGKTAIASFLGSGLEIKGGKYDDLLAAR